MKKIGNRLVLITLLAICIVAFAIEPTHMEKKQGALNDSIEVLEHEIDSGTMTEEEVMEEIRRGSINSPHSIGKMLAQGYMNAYKDTLLAEGYITQEDIEWGKWLVDTYFGGGSNQTTEPEPEPTPEPEPQPEPQAPVVEEAPVEGSSGEEPQKEGEEAPIIEEEPQKEITYPEPTVSEWEEVERVEATCSEEGYILYRNGAGEEKKDSLPKTKHFYTSEREEATCTSEGKIVHICDLCGDTYEEEIAKKEHSLTTNVKPQGWFSSGLKTVYCKVCGEVTEETTLPQLAPLPLYACIATVAGVVLLLVGVVAFIAKKCKKRR